VESLYFQKDFDGLTNNSLNLSTMLKSTKIARFLPVILIGLLLFQIGSAASVNSGKNRKKSATKKGTFYHLNNRSFGFKSTNGFVFKGGFQSLKTNGNDVTLHLHSMYYQKGNQLFVMPARTKVILPKFAAPKKTFF
jgi:hypothetical protein